MKMEKGWRKRGRKARKNRGKLGKNEK
jgi:hypothetical protein